MIGLYNDNKITDVSSNSTFSKFEPQNEDMIKLVEGLSSKFCPSLLDHINNNEKFQKAKWINIQGDPGLGKTHLLESIVNFFLEKGKSLKDINKFLYLSRDFSADLQASRFNNVKIILLDDLFSECENIDQISIFNIDCIMELILSIYEKKQIIISSTNFKIEDILKRVSSKDRIGRVASRVNEILSAGANNFHLKGDDYRTKIGKKNRNQDPFAI